VPTASNPCVTRVAKPRFCTICPLNGLTVPVIALLSTAGRNSPIIAFESCRPWSRASFSLKTAASTEPTIRGGNSAVRVCGKLTRTTGPILSTCDMDPTIGGLSGCQIISGNSWGNPTT
jgi:hypothetical protein